MTLQFKSATAPAPKSDNLKWETLDTDTLPAALKAKYEAWREAADFAKGLKGEFTKAMQAEVAAPDGTSFVLGYIYGKLSYAFAPIKTAKAKGKLVDFASLARK